MRWRRSGGTGFTVIELLIVMMAISIVVVTGLPPMFATVRGTRLESARQDLIGDLRLARMEAIRRNVPIAVVKTGTTTYAIDFIGARSLSGGVRFTSGPTTLRFAPIGRVTTGQASYTLHLDGRNAVVHVNTAGNATAK